jgi:hypothetical protein
MNRQSQWLFENPVVLESNLPAIERNTIQSYVSNSAVQTESEKQWLFEAPFNLEADYMATGKQKGALSNHPKSTAQKPRGRKTSTGQPTGTFTSVALIRKIKQVLFNVGKELEKPYLDSSTIQSLLKQALQATEIKLNQLLPKIEKNLAKTPTKLAIVRKHFNEARRLISKFSQIVQMEELKKQRGLAILSSIAYPLELAATRPWTNHLPTT